MSEKRYAILMGCSKSDYPFLGLNYTENDVKYLNEVLESESIGRFDKTFQLLNYRRDEVLYKLEEVLENAL